MDRQPPDVAVRLGHDLEWDPPAAMTAAVRWTCRRCGNAVLDYLGNIYGSATTEACSAPTLLTESGHE